MFFGDARCSLQHSLRTERRTDGGTDTRRGLMGRAVDFSLADFNTVTLLTPVTDAATAWVANHLPHNLVR